MLNGELVHSKGSLSFKPTEKVNFSYRFFYKVPFSNVGKGGFTSINGKRYHIPSWTEVHPETTLEDIMVEKKPFEELFAEDKEQTWEFKSASSDKTYTVRYNKSGNLSCNCWGYMAHKRCKHIKEVEGK